MSVVAPARAHHGPKRLSDRFALRFTRLLRWPADTFFGKRYGHRAGSPLRAALCAPAPCTRHCTTEAQEPAIDLHLSIHSGPSCGRCPSPSQYWIGADTQQAGPMPTSTQCGFRSVHNRSLKFEVQCALRRR